MEKQFLDAQEPGGEPTAADTLRAEVAAENLPDGAITVPFGDGKLNILDPNDWPSSANEDMQMGRFLSWARKALATDEDVQAWEDRDPTNREVEQVFTAIGEATGQLPKASAGLNRSSRRMQRR